MNARTLRSLLLAVMAVAIAACDGGTGGSGASQGVSYGAVTDFGSVFVNGVEFNTSGTAITMDGTPATQSDLRIGMVVTVSGSISGATGTASRIKVDGAVKGVVESVAADSNHMVVMGQTVLIDDQTGFENFTPPPAPGDFVSVHGHVTGNGVIAAGFVEKKVAPFPPFAVKGFVQSHNAPAQTFQVGLLNVSYNGATMVGDMPNGSWNGLLVEVKGTCASSPPAACGTLTATKVEPSGLTETEAMEAEVEGFVTFIASLSSFKIGTQAVVTNNSTVFEGGIPSDIALGVKLEAEGVLSGGILTAEKISFRDNIRFEADVAALGANSLTLSGLTGITVTVNSLTEFKGGIIGFGDLAVGNHLRIRGRVTTGTTVIATEIEKQSASTRVSLQGPVGSAMDPNVTILGVMVNTTGIAENDFRDVNDIPIGRTAFFAAAAPNVLVKARGALAGTSVTWDQIELED